MLRRFLKELGRRLSGKELVGVDRNGNRYYRWQEKEAAYTGRMIEKREVDFAKSGEYDPHSLPPEWVAWLHRFRPNPPTAEECQQIEVETAKRMARVAALEAEEEKRKYRVDSHSIGMAADAHPNMQRYVEQLTSLGYGEETRKATPTQPKES